jgi:hypothetical protein
MLKSKRFLATIVGVIIFIIGVFVFKIHSIELATGITILLAPYLAAESYSPSNIINNIKT